MFRIRKLNRREDHRAPGFHAVVERECVRLGASEDMPFDPQDVAPHLLGVFMIALACIPLLFVWQDRARRQAQRAHIEALQREARVAARLRGRSARDAERLVEDWLAEARRSNIIRSGGIAKN